METSDQSRCFTFPSYLSLAQRFIQGLGLPGAQHYLSALNVFPPLLPAFSPLLTHFLLNYLLSTFQNFLDILHL